ncbi:MAG TPA: thioredoxin-disulfide reductase, partial [Candidatus Dojkabacteria bacterium]|nr:thioredoxin-disulfide reductase [Candidatus Dojkabacteria bacterium]
MSNKTHELIIIGSGPAGLTAAIYASRANLKPLVIGGLKFGGQLMDTTEVENFPGFPEGIMGPELMQKFIEQAKRFGAEIIFKDVSKVDIQSDIKKVWVGEEMYQSKAIILATGAQPKKLGLDSEDKYWGKGVSSCATCDGAFFRGVEIAVVGGGDSVVEEATFLTRFASKVHLIVRKDSLRASKIMQDRATNHEKIEIHWNTEVQEVLGDGNKVTGLKILNNKTNKTSELPLAGMFLAIGHIPNVKLVEGVINQDDLGYLETDSGSTYTNIDGVFVAG